MEIVHEGYLKKSPPPKRLWRAKWRRRWFVLRSGELPGQYFLEYYTDNSRRKLKGKIDLDQCEQVDAGITFANRKFEYKYMFDIKTPKRVYYLCAETEEQMNKWVDCVCQVCGLKVFQPDEEYYDPGPLDPAGIHQRGQSQMDHMGNSMHHHHGPPTDTPPTPSHGRMDHSLGMDSPPISPVSPASTISGPYIPLKDCITGKKATNFPFNDHDMPPQNFFNDKHRSSVPNEMAPPAPILHGQEMPNTPSSVTGATAVTTGAKPRETRESYDIPRTLSRKSGASTDDTVSIQSPVETEGSGSVFSECEDVFGPAGISPGHHTMWDNGPTSTWDRNGRPSSSSTMLSRTRSISEDDHKLMMGAPPRPPKPPHLAPEIPQPEYQNLNNMDTIVQKTLVRTNSAKSQKNGLISSAALSYKSNNESAVMTSSVGPVGAMGLSDSEQASPMSVSSSLPPSTPREITDDMYDFPRSHHPDAVSPGGGGSERTKSRISYNNFAPTVFSYDPEKMCATNDFDPPISPGAGGQYSNIPVSAGGGRPYQPPCVDRGLKPKKQPGTTLTDNLSSLELSPPPSGGLMEDATGATGPGHPGSAGYIAPVVDRNLKPPKKIELEPAPRGSKHRSVPSPNSQIYNNGSSVGNNDSGSEADSISNTSSRRNSTNTTTEQTHFPLGLSRKGAAEEKSEIQYLDLDIADFPHQSPKTPKLPVTKVIPGPIPPPNNEASVVYKLVDFVKTDAFNQTRRVVENTYRNNQ